jgi:hypothetical protein
VRSWFQSLPFKCNLRRYNEEEEDADAFPMDSADAGAAVDVTIVVGLCRLNQDDP